MDEPIPAKNTDRELYREDLRDPLDIDNYYSPYVFVTENGNIGMGMGGKVVVLPIKDWVKFGWEFQENRQLTCGCVGVCKGHRGSILGVKFIEGQDGPDQTEKGD